MARWLTRRERHGWSWVELSARSGHPVWRLRYWQRRLEGASRPKRDRTFVAVDIAQPLPLAASSGEAIEITTPSGHRVTVAPGFDAEHLRQVLRALNASC